MGDDQQVEKAWLLVTENFTGIVLVVQIVSLLKNANYFFA